jgi:hypothetical protein
MMDSGVLISPASSFSGSHSNKQYARFFMPTSMLNILNTDASSSFIAGVGLASAFVMAKYSPSHEAIAGEP